MPVIQKVDISAWEEVKAPSAGFKERAELRSAISDMDEKSVLRLTPSRDEPMRKLKVMARWAAKEVGKEVQYAESSSGDLLIKMGAAEPKVSTGRGRPKSS